MNYRAVSFQSALTLHAIRDVLVADGTAKWRGGDNDLWGEYLTAWFSEDVRVRVFVDEDRFVADMSSGLGGADCEAAWSFVSEKLLPLVDAHDLRQHEGWG